MEVQEHSFRQLVSRRSWFCRRISSLQYRCRGVVHFSFIICDYIYMNPGFNFNPFAVQQSGSTPFFLFPMPFVMPMAPPTQEPKKEASENQKQGIQINLTAQELEAAGYETNKKAWTEEEDELLMRLFRKNDLSWKEIAQRIPGRTSKMCYSRYRRIESRSKEQWSRAEDAKLRQLVSLWGEEWTKIAESFPRRTTKQVQDHYMNYLRPEINREPWTLKEDLALIELLREFGKEWNQIEQRLPGRTQNQIKNRYFGRLKRLHDRKLEEEGEESRKADDNS